MRAILGFVVVHVVLIATGFALLRALGLVPTRWNARFLASALGPALLAGVAVVVPVLIVLLVIGIPLTLISAAVVCFGWAGAAELVVRHRARPTSTPAASDGARRRVSPAGAWLRRVGIVAAGAYLVGGAFVLARVPTVLDDARIWSLRGVTLAYYHGLQPEIFQNQLQSGGHPIYPLFQPVLEALVAQAMGHPQLRFFHVELWLLSAAAIWTAGYLIARGAPRIARSEPLWIAPLALVAVMPAAIHNIVMGYADMTGSVILAVGAVALALWLDQGEVGLLALAAILLAAAANTKDEDLVAAGLVLVVGLTASVVRARHHAFGVQRTSRLRLFGAAVLGFLLLVTPWRIWTAAHHLSDSIRPPLPRALSPAYIFDRTHELHQAITAMLTQTLTQWGWLAAIFIAACVICLITRTARHTVWFYLASFAAIVISLLWLYTTTPISLAFLLPTSMGRTVGLFMLLAGLATAHLLAQMPGSSLRTLFRRPDVTR